MTISEMQTLKNSILEYAQARKKASERSVPQGKDRSPVFGTSQVQDWVDLFVEFDVWSGDLYEAIRELKKENLLVDARLGWSAP